MRGRTEDLGPGPPAADVLGRLARAATRRADPPPAALIGEWLGADAVLAPSLDVAPGVGPDDGRGYWFGAFAYPDAAQADRVDPPSSTQGGHTDDVLLLADGCWRYHHVHGRRCPDWLHECLSENVCRPNPFDVAWTPPVRAPHDSAIAACLDAIAAGEIYQACVCTRFTGRLQGDAVDFYRIGAATMRPRKSAFLVGSRGAVVSFSPETFLRRHGARVTSHPIKGTVDHHTDPGVLRNSVKDVAENVMIVDLVRNDLGRVATVGGVSVPELLCVEPAPGVWHLVSTVAAELEPDVDTRSLLHATFPPGSVTGTPKIRAQELLSQWETHSRGVYCGAIGVVAPDGDLDLNVAIRTVEIEPGGAMVLGVGGGITIDSDPDREWQECLDKAAPIVSLVSPR